MRTFRFSPWLLSPLALAVLSAQAQTGKLDTLIVTPSRTAQTIADTNASVTVFTREDIARSPARTLDELLVGVPGVSVANTGGYGKQTGLFVRGTESNHTLVLIDGVRINTAKDGAAMIQHLPLAQIERIEVVRGPRSSLYGSDAMGGVIQVFTRQARAEFEAHSEATVGNMGTTQFSQYLAGQQDGTQWDLSLSAFATDGEDAQRDVEPDRDGYDNRALSAGVRQQVGEALTLGARIYRAQGEADYDSGWPADSLHASRFVQQTLSTSADWLLSDRLNVNVQLSRAEDRMKEIVSGVADDAAVGTRDTLGVRLDYTLSDTQNLIWGLERSEDEIRTPGATYDATDRYNNAAFAQWMGQVEAFTHQLSLRYDDNQQFGDEVTGSVVLGYQVAPWFSPYVSYGTAFVTPTFVDLYYPGSGNPDLDPERGKTYELGLKGQAGVLAWTLNGFRSEIDDLIIYSGGRMLNVANTRIEGIESSVSASLDEWWLELAAGYTRAVDEDTDLQLIRRPKWSGRSSVRRDFGVVAVRTDLRVQGASWDNDFSSWPAERVRLAGHVLTDLALTWRPRERLELEAKSSNLFDQGHETVAGYNSYGRQIMGTVRYTY
ncbi:MAG: TonB-dependent receptor [Gammaproteobacteria bacterium]|nr:TonB-dependent receptor [Gammaproteobacteria bacterium]